MRKRLTKQEEAQNIVREQRWEPEGREFPGDTVTLYRVRWQSFLRIVGLAQDLLEQLQASPPQSDRARERMSDLEHALREHGFGYAPNGHLYVKIRSMCLQTCDRDDCPLTEEEWEATFDAPETP